MFYERIEGPVPRRWVRKVKASLRSLGPQVLAARMVRDYVEQLYEPTAARADRLDGRRLRPARALAAWKVRVLEAWNGVRVDAVDTEATVASLGTTRTVEAVVATGTLGPDDIEVQLVHGPVGLNDEIEPARREVVTMQPVDREPGAGDGAEGRVRYRGEFMCDTAGRYGFTVRMVPAHPDLASPLELGRVAWAS